VALPGSSHGENQGSNASSPTCFKQETSEAKSKLGMQGEK